MLVLCFNQQPAYTHADQSIVIRAPSMTLHHCIARTTGELVDQLAMRYVLKVLESLVLLNSLVACGWLVMLQTVEEVLN